MSQFLAEARLADTDFSTSVLTALAYRATELDCCGAAPRPKTLFAEPREFILEGTASWSTTAYVGLPPHRSPVSCLKRRRGPEVDRAPAGTARASNHRRSQSIVLARYDPGPHEDDLVGSDCGSYAIGIKSNSCTPISSSAWCLVISTGPLCDCTGFVSQETRS